MCPIFESEIDDSPRKKCKDPFLPKCSCTEVCGSMLQIPYGSLKKSYLRPKLETVASKIPQIGKNGKNMAIVNPSCHKSSYETSQCQYILQILSPNYNDKVLKDFRKVLEKENVNYLYVSSSDRSYMGQKRNSILLVFVGLGVCYGALVVGVVVAFRIKALFKLKVSIKSDMELTNNDVDNQNDAFG